MKLYLRNEKGDNLVALDVWVETEGGDSFVDISVKIDIPSYSNLLLSNLNKIKKIIYDFDNINQLRGWLWERYFTLGKNDGSQFEDVINKLKITLNKVAKDYKLKLIED